MKNPTLWIIVAALAIIGGSIWWKSSQKIVTATPAPNSADIVLYYGNTCPHCKIVEQYLTDNKVPDKVKFAQKEVYDNKDNALELAARAKTCGLDTDAIGVPFLWDGKECIQGQEQVIAFFKDRAGIK